MTLLHSAAATKSKKSVLGASQFKCSLCSSHDDDDDEEEEEDRVDLFVLFSSCRHLPVGHFFASSSPLSATKLGIEIRMISCWVAP